MLRVRTDISGGFGGAKVNTAYFIPTTDDAVSSQAAVDAIRDFWTAIASLVSNAYTFQVSGVVASITPANGQQTAEFTVTPRNVAGTNTGSRLPPQIQAGIAWTTNVFILGRRLRGRWFIPGMVEENNNNDGTLSATAQTQLANATAGLVAPPLAAGDMVVWSRSHGQAGGIIQAAVRSYYFTLNSRRD